MSRDKKAEAANETAEAKADRTVKPTEEVRTVSAHKVSKTKTKAEQTPKRASAPYSKDVDPPFGDMDEKALREIFSEMEQTAIDLGITTGVAAPEPKLPIDEIRQQCKNLHNFIKVRTTEAKVLGDVKKKSKADRQKASAINAAEGDENMAKKAVKKTAKKAASKKNDGKWKGYDLTAKIVKLKDHNMTGAKGERWNRALKCKTVADFKASKLPPACLKNMIKAKVVKVA